LLGAIGIGANLQSQVRPARLRPVAVVLGLVLALALTTAITAFLSHQSGQAIGIQEVVAEMPVFADDDRTPCRESHKASDGSCIAAPGCAACTVLPQDTSVVAIQVSSAVRPLSPSVLAQMRFYPIHQPPKIVSI
jgi:hypothetical protein